MSLDSNYVLALKLRQARIISLIASFVCVSLIVALWILIPLRTTVPYLVRVEGSSVSISELSVEGMKTLRSEDAFLRDFVHGYIIDRETYVHEVFSNQVERLRYRTDASEFEKYLSLLRDEKDPLNPRFAFEGGVAVPYVKSIAAYSEDKNTYLVNFDVKHENEEKSYQVIVSLGFNDSSVDEKQSWENSMGVFVTRYVKTQLL